MSQTIAKVGPDMSVSVAEISATFPTEAALQEAISQLTLVGFDRADISRPITGHSNVVSSSNTESSGPELSAANPNTPTDQQQMRTIHTSMAGAVGAIAAAGVTIATGGAAAVAIGAAVAAGAGAGLVANLASSAANVTSITTDGNPLILTVRTGSPDRELRARDAMAHAGAKGISTVSRDLSTATKTAI